MLAAPETIEAGLFSRARHHSDSLGRNARPHVHTKQTKFHSLFISASASNSVNAQ